MRPAPPPERRALSVAAGSETDSQDTLVGREESSLMQRTPVARAGKAPPPAWRAPTVVAGSEDDSNDALVERDGAGECVSRRRLQDGIEDVRSGRASGVQVSLEFLL